MSLKNIVYIDYEKVYSLSSQLFEGVIHSAIEHQETSLSNINAVKVTAEKKSSKTSDTSKLSTVINPHDYHYLKFERELFDRKLIQSIENGKFTPEDINTGSFIKIKASIQINDYEKLKYTTKNFTKLGYAINYVHKNDALEGIDLILNNPETSPHIKKKMAAERSKIIKKIEDLGMKSKKDFFDNLSEVLNYAYGDEIEISQEVDDHKFTSFLTRNFLKLPPELIVKFYSRRTITEFNIVGIVTQSPNQNKVFPERILGDIRSAAWNMNDSLADLESTFCVPGDKEFFIEPIALYTEI